MFCTCRGVSLSQQELCCTQLARLFAREHSNREKRVKFDKGFTVHSAIPKSCVWDIFRIFPSGSSHVRGQQCTVAIEEKRFSHRGAATQAVILKTVCLL